MVAVLQVLSGKEPGRAYELHSPTTRLGRHPDCEVLIDMGSVSRFHAHILRDGTTYFVEDLQSRNGTFVNGQKIAGRVALAAGDQLKICDTLFVFHGEGVSPDHLPPSPDPAVFASEEDSQATVVTSIDASNLMLAVRPEVKLRAILELTRAVGRTVDLRELFSKILASLFTIFPQADRGLILIRQPDGRLDARGVRHRRSDSDDIRYSKTIVNTAMQEKKGILSQDTGADSRFAMAQSIADIHIRSVICAPLLTQENEAIGVIQLDTQSLGERFEHDELELLVSVASQASLAIESAQLHQQLLVQERMTRELGLARDIQRGFLPQRLPQVPGYEFWAFYQAAGEVGGDYFDFVATPSGRLAAIVGDVSGKGVPAALVMSKAASDTKIALITMEHDLAAAMENISASIEASTPDDRFITMAICLLEPATGLMHIVNAGHMSPMIRRGDGRIDEPADESVTGLPAGIMSGTLPYQAITVELYPGDVVVMFSDGISESMSVDNREFTLDRIRHIIHQVNAPPPHLGQAILDEVKRHAAGAKQNDDITLVVFGRQP